MNQQIQQNLNQIVSMCNQLSQSERTAAQQLQHCAQLCQQVSQQISQQMQQMSTQQYSNLNTNQQHFTASAPGSYGAQSGTATSSWASRPINTGAFSTSGFGGGQYAYSGGGQQYGAGRFETSRELTPTGASAFNTNKDLNS